LEIGSAQRKLEQPLQLDRERAEIEANILFYIVASASFVEITSDLYTRNLVEFFEDDAEIVSWLSAVWEAEELGHGTRLRSHVKTAWPEFDWASAYARYHGEFSLHCTQAGMAASQAEELVALCVVETGTASLYRMLANASDGPKLRQIAARIAGEEIGHYKQFLRYFLRHRACGRLSTGRILRAVWSQITAIESEDAYYAFKHVYMSRNPSVSFNHTAYVAFRRSCRKLASRHFPYGMAIKMLLKLLPLHPIFQRFAVPPLASMSRLLFSI
jgi:hypothetical protein